MAVKFLETADADFGVGIWTSVTADNSSHNPSASSVVVHGWHQRATLYSNASTTNCTADMTGLIADSGGRMSFYLYHSTFPSAVNTILVCTTSGNTICYRVRITSTGQLQLWEGSVQIGSSGSTLALNTWYRITFCWKVTSTTVNEFRLFVNGTLDISVSNATLTTVNAADAHIGNGSGSLVCVMYTSDHYLDDSNSLLDTGDVWVAAKRPFANGTLNQFTTQIGSAGSGYGSGHAPQVNERAQSDTNGWSISTTAKQTEEYNVETAGVGDVNLPSVNIIDFMGWVRAAESTTSNTPVTNIIVNGVATAITLTTSAAVYRKMAGIADPPLGGGADIGMDGQYTSVAGVFSLYECGLLVAFTKKGANMLHSNNIGVRPHPFSPGLAR